MLTVVYGPQASGKTRNRDKFASHYGHTTIIDGISRQHRSRRFYDDAARSTMLFRRTLSCSPP